MTVSVTLPEIGSREATIRISCWLVYPGETVEKGDRIVEVGIPGAIFDVESPATGLLTRIEKSFDSIVAAGDILGWIETDEGS